MFQSGQMVPISVAVKLVFKEKTEACLFGQDLVHYAVVFAFSSLWHLCFTSYLPGSSFLMINCFLKSVPQF